MHQARDRKWDGKSVEVKGDLHEWHRSDRSFINTIISLFYLPESESGATWLLKRYLRDHEGIDDTLLDKIFGSHGRLQHWQAQLHLLQCLSHSTIAKSNKKKLELFLRACLTSSNKFVGAWSYNGFYQLAHQHPQYQQETKVF
ncbi:MAG: hypothetical protein N0E37_09590 [Candidatus Thiodiazotropha taylori]|nr:hypothetical protein [Candidatus Thiodiazotropha taylori]MCG7963931.1 hypothetical protein [Candidatus Thiodiazotropha endolucinida]MCG7905928.1 hypothetical protein [Candidatus Thiodiazotropha taylori]MCG7917991.1 hypothetical protein [Candidatus Thiodiazotropha taylori]MCG7936821.1 hypothetical protein [Candidatus Thiodiazotropha taylori]